MNDTVDRFYQATGELMVKAADYDALSARCEELERRLAGAWCVKELEWEYLALDSWEAVTPVGIIRITRFRGHEGKSVVLNAERVLSDGHADSDAAKAAAQQWFNEKMTAGLRRIV